MMPHSGQQLLCAWTYLVGKLPTEVLVWCKIQMSWCRHLLLARQHFCALTTRRERASVRVPGPWSSSAQLASLLASCCLFPFLQPSVFPHPACNAWSLAAEEAPLPRVGCRRRRRLSSCCPTPGCSRELSAAALASKGLDRSPGPTPFSSRHERPLYRLTSWRMDTRRLQSLYSRPGRVARLVEAARLPLSHASQAGRATVPRHH